MELRFFLTKMILEVSEEPGIYRCNCSFEVIGGKPFYVDFPISFSRLSDKEFPLMQYVFQVGASVLHKLSIVQEDPNDSEKIGNDQGDHPS